MSRDEPFSLVEERIPIDFWYRDMLTVRTPRRNDVYADVRYVLPPDWDGRSDHHDGEWVDVIFFPYTSAEFDGRTVPLFQGYV